MHKEGVNKDNEGGIEDNENGAPGKFFFVLTIMFANDYIDVNYTTNGDRRPPPLPQ